MSPQVETLKLKLTGLLTKFSELFESKLDKIAPAVSAYKLTNPFDLSFTGDATGTQSVQGDANVAIALTLANTAVAPGVYPKVTVDAKGRVTAGTLLLAADIPALDAAKVTTGAFGADRIPALPTSKITGLDTALSNKLNSAVYTASDVLAKLQTVDGAGSGLDADLLDGKELAVLEAEYRAYTDTAVNVVKSGTVETARRLEGKTLAQVQQAVIDENLLHVNGRRGELAFFTEEGTPMALSGGELVVNLRVGEDDATINALKSSTVAFADIYDKWQRISHSNTLKFPASETEANGGWAYNADTDSVNTTVNSSTMIGLISPDQFDSYVFDTLIKSTAADNDSVGLCAAFKRVGDREHTVTVMMSAGGMKPDGTHGTVNPTIWCSVNYMQGTANGQLVLWSQELGIAGSNFNLAGSEIANGIRIALTRNSDGTLNIRSTKADGTDWPNPVNAKVTLPELFQTKCSIGYVAVSQPSTTWSNFSVPTLKTDVIDIRDYTVWRWDNVTSTWIVAGTAIDETALVPGRIYRNTEAPYTAYYLDFEGNFLSLGQPLADSGVVAGTYGSETAIPRFVVDAKGRIVSIETVAIKAGTAIAVNEYVTVTAGGVRQYDLQTLLGAAHTTFDKKTAEICVRAKDTNGSSPMYNAYANAEAMVSYGLKDERYVIIANQSSVALELYVKVLIHPN